MQARIEFLQVGHHALVRFTEHALNLVNPKGRPRRVVPLVLNINNVHVHARLRLHLIQVEEVLPVHPQSQGVKIIAKELEKF